MATETEPLSAKEAALELKTDARTLRKFLRKRNGLVGQGQRWEIDRSELKALRKEFDAWAKGTASKDKDKVKPQAEPPADDLDDDEGLEETDEDELDDLEEI